LLQLSFVDAVAVVAFFDPARTWPSPHDAHLHVERHASVSSPLASFALFSGLEWPFAAFAAIE